jgi:hypothetical protein
MKGNREQRTIFMRSEGLVCFKYMSQVIGEYTSLCAEIGAGSRLKFSDSNFVEPIDELVELLRRGKFAGLEGSKYRGSFLHDGFDSRERDILGFLLYSTEG